VGIRSNIRKIRRQKRYTKIDFSSTSGYKLEEIGDRRSSSEVYFSIQTPDSEKAAKLKEANTDIKRVIYNKKLYPMGPNVKTLTV
jgi:hypothetical protein